MVIVELLKRGLSAQPINSCLDLVGDKYRDMAGRVGWVGSSEPRLRDVDWRYGRHGTLYFATLLWIVVSIVLADQDSIAARVGLVGFAGLWLWMVAEYLYWLKNIRVKNGGSSG